MNIMGQKKMELQQVIDTCTGVPRREDVVKNDTVVNPRWDPISHSTFVSEVAEALEHHGYKITESAFALNNTGYMLVGGFQIESPLLPHTPGHTDSAFELFLRHSHDMSYGIQLAVGRLLMVCTNGCMSGDVIARHKHTSGFDLRQWMRNEALSEFMIECENQLRFEDDMKALECSDATAHEIILESMSQGLIPLARGKDVYEEWKNPTFNEEDFPRNTAWKLLADYTYAAQKCQAPRQMDVCEKAPKFVEERCKEARLII